MPEHMGRLEQGNVNALLSRVDSRDQQAGGARPMLLILLVVAAAAIAVWFLVGKDALDSFNARRMDSRFL